MRIWGPVIAVLLALTIGMGAGLLAGRELYPRTVASPTPSPSPVVRTVSVERTPTECLLLANLVQNYQAKLLQAVAVARGGDSALVDVYVGQLEGIGRQVDDALAACRGA